MSDQEQRIESDAEGLADPPGYRDNPGKTLTAVRKAGEAHGLSSDNNPLYAHLLNVAHRLDSPFLDDQHLPALSNEFRQLVKHVGLDKIQTGERVEVNILTSLGSGLKRPTRTG